MARRGSVGTARIAILLDVGDPPLHARGGATRADPKCRLRAACLVKTVCYPAPGIGEGLGDRCLRLSGMCFRVSAGRVWEGTSFLPKHAGNRPRTAGGGCGRLSTPMALPSNPAPSQICREAPR